MRQIAYEGRCFVLSACLRRLGGRPERFRRNHRREQHDCGARWQRSAGPLFGAGLLSAEIDLKEIIRCKVDLDIVGHYSRRDIFDLRLIVP